MRVLKACALALAVSWVTSLAPAQSKSLEEAQREDLEFLQTTYLPRERAFTPETRAAAQALVGRLLERAGKLSPAELFLGFAETTALADNPHSTAGFGKEGAVPTKKLPLVLAWFEDAGLVVLRAAPPCADLAGASIVAIDGHPIAEVMKVLRRYYGGPEPRRMILAPGLITTGGMLQAAGIASRPDGVRLTVRARNGAQSDRDVPYVATASLPNRAWWPSRWWSPEPIAGDSAPWATAISPDNLPLYLREGELFHRTVAVPELQALYLQLKTSERERGTIEFAQRAEAQIGSTKPRHLIVDLRFNKGGDLRNTAALIQKVPSLLPQEGRIYVIVGRYTFSAGIVAAAMLMKSGGKRTIVVGEDMSDRLRFWSEGNSLCAPNSGFCARYTEGYFDLVDGCAGEDGCYFENRSFDFVVGRIEPQLKAPMTAAAYFAKRDPALEAIEAHMRGTPN